MTPRTALCVFYALVALAALVATWGQNLAYFQNPADFFTALGLFVNDTKVNPAARSITVDIGLFFLAAAVWMVAEARRLGVKFVWAYIAGGLFIAISVTFPLFLIARELKLAESDAKNLRAVDVIPLALFTALIAALSFYISF